MGEKNRGGFLLEIVTFVSGALVMIYEVTGSRLLAPFLGTSTYIWTSLIGVILGALSLGYWLGGRIADRKPDVKILAGVLLAGAILMCATILLKDSILSLIALLPVAGLEIKALLAAIILFAPVSVLFGFVTPYVVRLRMSDVADAGKTVGRLYALSTVGSIAGTFLAGFVLLPTIGSTRILYLIAGTLLVLAFSLAPISLIKGKTTAIILLISAISFSELQTYAYRTLRDQHDFDTEYSRILVKRGTDSKTGAPTRVLTTDPYSFQSGMFLETDELLLEYSKYYHLIRHFQPGLKNTLIIGGAGYSFPKDYVKKYPQAKIEVVEIDPAVTEIARRFFRFENHPNLKIIHEDGRTFLNRAESGKYDAVLIDAFGSLLNVPFHLTTIEAVQNINRALAENGVVIVNLYSAIQGGRGKFLAAEYKTYADVFPSVHVFKIYPETPDEKPQNLILLASKNSRLSFDSQEAEIARMLANRYTKEIAFDVPILTDELAPVEYYNSLAYDPAD